MRLVTRGDMDGLTCSVIITECEPVDEIVLVHPQDVTDKRVAIMRDDILANLPYHPDCGKWFDHHLLTESNEKPPEKFEGAFGLAPSAARVTYGYYLPRHPELRRFEAMVREADRLDSAQLSREDVLDPKGFVLLGLTLDPRTGLGTFQEYFKALLTGIKKKGVEDVLRLPEVQERVARMREQDARFREVTRTHSRMDGNVVFTDFRPLESIPVGNRFLVYTLFPDANVSLRVHWGPSRQHVAATVGHSIFNRTCPVNVGELMSNYGGGGHRGAGTCLLPAARADAQIAEIIAALKKA